MCNLYETIDCLCKNAGKTITQMCSESGIARASLTDLKMGRKKSLSAQTLGKIAAYFGVSVDYLLGMEDEYGISPDEWALMGDTFKSSRESMGFSRELAVDGEVLTDAQLADFEENGAPLTPAQLTATCGLVGLDPTIVFSPWRDNLWPQKEKPTVIDDELADELEMLRSRPEVRTLLHASKGMSAAQVERMAQFMIDMKGGSNESSD